MYDDGIVTTLPLHILNFSNHLTYANSFWRSFVFGPRKEIEMPDFSGLSSLQNQNKWINGFKVFPRLYPPQRKKNKS